VKVDLNADLGESWPRWTSGEDVALLDVVTSANICCGAYAGDAELMRSTCEAAAARGVSIGAQVGYPDRANFGRARFEIGAAELTREVTHQIRLLDEMARSVGSRVSYVKPHGALYNTAVVDEGQASAVIGAILDFGSLPVLGLPGSALLRQAADAGLRAVPEGFADRGYLPSGELVPRSRPDALIDEPNEVAAQAVRMAVKGEVLAVDGTVVPCQVESLCVHGDTPGAAGLALAVRSALAGEGVSLAPFVR
jgi:UPF0271 protein